jgi:phospholipase/lecithinase/hemolysin
MECFGSLVNKATLLVLTIILKFVALNNGEPQVPCYFIFGDSLVDNGNNNDFITAAKVNYPPYGIDYPGGIATGRFTNNQTQADILGLLMGFEEPIPSFRTARGRDILKGVNYGSGGAGIRSESGTLNLGRVISLDEQILNHINIIAKTTILQGNTTLTKEFLSKCIYTVGMGSNDYLNNYLMPDRYLTSRLYTPQEFADELIKQYTGQLKVLYKLGARKVAVFGLGLVGCTPALIKKYGADASGCVDRPNGLVQLFNDKLKPLVNDFNANLTDAKYTYINTTNISLGDPTAAGITVLNVPCCDPLTTTAGKGQCEPNQPPCTKRNMYVFWDGFHPTDIVNRGSASRSYTALSPMDAYPVDISTLINQ